MKTGIIAIIVFALMVAAQWYVPLSMIRNQERIIELGNSFKFKVAPIDPNDPFRGKYVYLNYTESSVKTDPNGKWPSEWDFREKEAFATIKIDSLGFAYFDQLLLDKPTSGDFLKIRVTWYDNEENRAFITIPFDRYYMEESKAPKAEEFYQNSVSGGMNNAERKEAWALISVLDGEGVLSGLIIEGRSIEDWVSVME